MSRNFIICIIFLLIIVIIGLLFSLSPLFFMLGTPVVVSNTTVDNSSGNWTVNATILVQQNMNYVAISAQWENCDAGYPTENITVNGKNITLMSGYIIEKKSSGHKQM